MPSSGRLPSSPRLAPRLLGGVLLLLPLPSFSAPPEREFWRPDAGPGGHPVEVRVRADLLARGTHVLVYREGGFTPAGDSSSLSVEELVAAFDTVIHPCLTAVFGPAPDIDGNGAVIVLITRVAGGAPRFWRFNQLPDEVAQRSGFHSNQAEILYTDLGFAGNRRRDNLTTLASAYAEMLLYARDPAETAWGRAVAAYAPYRCGLSGPRLLWGEEPRPGQEDRSGDRPPGLWLLALHYLYERVGDEGLAALARNPAEGQAAWEEVSRARGVADSAAAMLADAAMAAWLADPDLADGRFSFRTVHPPRQLDAPLDPSRASAGNLPVPVGFPAYLHLRPSGDRSNPLTLQGQPEVRWVGRAVLLRPRGPDVELPLVFGADGLAQLDLSELRPGEEVVVAVLPLPAASPTFDRRQVTLYWGFGWIPRLPRLAMTEDFRRLLSSRFPDGGTSAIASLATLMGRLTGERAPSRGDAITTRYAWAPAAARVADLLLAEAADRSLPARRQSFLRVTPTRVTQEWSNVLIELPGADPRRWPVVVAAHWDATRTHIDDAYSHALAAHDNASGVAVALEAAGAIARARRRAPVVVALLAGGAHGAAGAQALLDELQGRVTAWIELDGVGTPEAYPHHTSVTVEGGASPPMVTAAVLRALREQGLVQRPGDGRAPSHSGAAAAQHRGVPAVVLRTSIPPPGAPETDLPAEVDLATTSPELQVLLARAVASMAVALAGPVIP